MSLLAPAASTAPTSPGDIPPTAPTPATPPDGFAPVPVPPTPAQPAPQPATPQPVSLHTAPQTTPPPAPHAPLPPSAVPPGATASVPEVTDTPPAARRSRTPLAVGLGVVVVAAAVAGFVLLQGDDGSNGSIGLGQSVDGSLDSGGDVDRYELDVPIDTGVTIKLIGHTDTDIDVLLRLLSEDGEVLAEDDDGLGGDSGHDAILDLATPVDGPVIIEASTYEGETSGSYTLVVEPWE